ncbi:unnamed protein product [Leptidea sinapis]|uniref:Uncharacterized protein n=1 Tax=Leptidea sinapis TaxID=189913 RepID=A0A5E4Q0W1_9NEOP|nr:unnamed protein product [Leptidea sinapis]
MGVPMVKNCCCIASLHTGTLIIGYVYTVWALLELAGYSLLVTFAPISSPEGGRVSAHRRVLYIAAALVSGLHLLCSLVLIFAAYKVSFTIPLGYIKNVLPSYNCHDKKVVHDKIYNEIKMLPINKENHPRIEHAPGSTTVDNNRLARDYLSVLDRASVSIVLQKLASLTLPWTIVTGIMTALFFVMCLTGISLILQDSGEMLEIESVVIAVHLARACISVYCIIVVHSRHKQIMFEEDEVRFQRSGRLYRPVHTTEPTPLPAGLTRA